MRKSSLTIDLIKNKIDELVGKNIYMEVCRGRKQVKKYFGVVENAYSRIFVVRLTDSGTPTPSLSYSYSDILCGEVIIELRTNNSELRAIN